MTRWYTNKKKEHFYKEAKRVGYRARSAFKLKQIQKKFKIIGKGDIVIDLGAAPGGWSQVAKELVGDEGKIIGIDILPIEPIKEIVFLQIDLRKESSLHEIEKTLKGDKVDLIISDMSPEISGNYSIDQARSIHLCNKALEISKKLLKNGGNFLCKVFEGEDLQDFLEKVKLRFRFVKYFSPPASRKTSSEIYVIAKNFQINDLI